MWYLWVTETSSTLEKPEKCLPEHSVVTLRASCLSMLKVTAGQDAWSQPGCQFLPGASVITLPTARWLGNKSNEAPQCFSRRALGSISYPPRICNRHEHDICLKVPGVGQDRRAVSRAQENNWRYVLPSSHTPYTNAWGICLHHETNW